MIKTELNTLENEVNEKLLKAKKSARKKKQIITFSIIGIIGIVALILLMPVSERVSYQTQEKYDVEYSVNELQNVEVEYLAKVPYTKQVAYEAPIYKTIKHEDPVYETLYTYQLIDSGIDTTTENVENAYEAERLFTGIDIWGNKEYKVIVYHYDGLSKWEKTFYEINSVKRIDTYQDIVSFNQWTEEVIDGYETRYKTETEYKMEPRFRTESQYVEVEKTREETRTVTKYRRVSPMLIETILQPERFT